MSSASVAETELRSINDTDFRRAFSSDYFSTNSNNSKGNVKSMFNSKSSSEIMQHQPLLSDDL